MARRSQTASQAEAGKPRAPARVLLIEARYYEEISDELAEGAIAELEAAGATFERLAVAGCLEIPLALALAVEAGRFGSGKGRADFDGCIALGCVIRGETTHYDTVCNNANHWLMDVAVRHAIPLGNAILTVENEAQALERARGGRKGKGADAVRACLGLIESARAMGRAVSA
ncbi:MAG TPA: 6,7-dimethyl-8-ribityllumazine synthase [Hyphomicrobiaceae bacterium]|jgi:6,7-dimethyl-8-ribityllumazine synthase|nr:6,7-dimethyl-8-ribityllumazine synthase [Hyphomicrobiaceae bacterium]